MLGPWEACLGRILDTSFTSRPHGTLIGVCVRAKQRRSALKLPSEGHLLVIHLLWVLAVFSVGWTRDRLWLGSVEIELRVLVECGEI